MTKLIKSNQLDIARKMTQWSEKKKDLYSLKGGIIDIHDYEDKLLQSSGLVDCVINILVDLVQENSQASEFLKELLSYEFKEEITAEDFKKAFRKKYGAEKKQVNKEIALVNLLKTLDTYLICKSSTYPENYLINRFNKEVGYWKQQSGIEQIGKDIPRVFYLETPLFNFNYHMKNWLRTLQPELFNQGLRTGQWFDVIRNDLGNFLIAHAELCQTFHGVEATDFLQKDLRNNLDFAYIDDKGLPCGVFISCLPDNLYVAVVIRNTTAAPEEREVLLLGSDKLVSYGKATKHSEKEFLQSLGSKSIRSLFEESQLFNSKGGINPHVVKDLSSRFNVEDLNDERKNLVQLRVQQLQEVIQWQLTEEQFALFKEKLHSQLDKKEIKENQQFELSQQRVESLRDGYFEDLIKKETNQSFFGRYALPLFQVGLVLLAAATVASALFFPPALFVVGLAFCAFFVNTVIKSADKRALAIYKKKMSDEENNITRPHEQKLADFDQARQVSNERDSLKQAVLEAEFTEQEFAELKRDMEEVLNTEPSFSSQESTLSLGRSSSTSEELTRSESGSPLLGKNPAALFTPVVKPQLSLEISSQNTI